MNPADFYNAYIDRKNAEWDKLYEKYDTAVDWPTVTFYKDLLQQYPDAKVNRCILGCLYAEFINKNIILGHPYCTYC